MTDTLPKHHREVIDLVDDRAMSYEEAAAHLQVPVGTVRSRLHRARKAQEKADLAAEAQREIAGLKDAIGGNS